MGQTTQEKVENKIIDCISSGVAGRLIIFKPEKRGLEDYLAVERRGKYKDKEIYFRVNFFTGHLDQGSFSKDLSPDEININNGFYLLFVYFDEVRQKLSDYVWLVPSSQFKDLAEEIKLPEGQDLLRFKVPLDVKNKNQFSKFIIKTEFLGDVILNALEKGGRFSFKGVDFANKRKVNLESLKEFLCEARSNTYASGASSADNPRLLGSEQLEFQKGSYFYRDIFFNGDKKFIGQEIIYQDSKPIWGMNYVGNQIGRIVLSFLRESLMKLFEKCRMGGDCEYDKREYKYADHGQGDLGAFLGKEEILVNNESIYVLSYQGGLISEEL